MGHEETYLQKAGWAEVGKRLKGWLIIQEHYFREPEFLTPRKTTEKFNPRGSGALFWLPKALYTHST